MYVYFPSVHMGGSGSDGSDTTFLLVPLLSFDLRPILLEMS